jgi:ADP-ribose pyrophosphatase YjhB (NUDIX family)
VGGAVEAGESALEAAMRELHEELGPLVLASPLGLAHAWNFRYDDDVRWMTDLAWVASYDGGELVPGDDMAGSESGWFAIDNVESLGIAVPEGQDWLLRRALTVYRTYRGDPIPRHTPS